MISSPEFHAQAKALQKTVLYCKPNGNAQLT